MRKLLLAATTLAAAAVMSSSPLHSAQAAVQVKTVDYQQGGTALEG
jgi:hypothetical protein